MSDVDLGVTPDGEPMEGAPVLEPLEHSVLEKSPDGGFTEGAPVLEPLEHSVLGETPDGGPMVGAPVLESIEHSVPEKALDDRPMVGILDPLEHSVLDVDMDSLWMAPWDAGGTFRIGSRPKVAIRGTDCVVLFSYLAGRRFRLRVISDILEASQGHVLLTCTLGCRPPRSK